MKTRFSELLRSFCVPSWIVVAVGPWAAAQTAPVMDVHLYAGLSITGVVGTVYSIEYVTDLSQTNNPNAWRCLEFLQLPASPYLWADKSTPVRGQRFYRAVAFAAPTNMVFIPPGTFRMGSPTNEIDRLDDESPQMAVTISRGFWMGKYEVTQSEFEAVTGDNPSSFRGPDLPVEMVLAGGSDPFNPERFFAEYCRQITQRDRATGRIPTNCVYRLPTEAEWEYACRAQTSTRFSYGDDPGYTNLTNYAWYSVNSGETTHPVGQKLPNNWGLYDMHGNVWEVCQDNYGEYPGGIALDPQGSATGWLLVVRGGSWMDWAPTCRSARRWHDTQVLSYDAVGFRVVLAAGQP